MEVQAELVQELREKFFKKLEDEGPPDSRDFHPADIARIKNTDDWLWRFLEHNECNIQESLTMLWESCTWRKKFGTNDITEENVKKSYLEEGFCFPYGKDKDGKFMFVIKSKLHVKGSKDFSELQRCIVYWFERLEREGNGNQISLFFDMAEAGLSNLDMDLTKYLIGLFKTYYPNFLNYIIIFEMPWILNAAFKLIKSWLPPKAVPKIKFVNKTNLKEYVDPNEALKCWGGNNDYTFKFVSETKNEGNDSMNGNLTNKKVHFGMTENSPITEQSTTNFSDQPTEDHLLSVEPETITFNKVETEVTGTITLKNITTDQPLSFKIKTTSPEKFKVRPSSGVLQPQEQRVITVVLQPGYTVRRFLSKDRFLVMCLPLKNASAKTQELAALWKVTCPATLHSILYPPVNNNLMYRNFSSKSGQPAEEHKLDCCASGIDSNDTQKSPSMLSSSMTNGDRTSDSAVSSKLANLEKALTDTRHDVVIIKYSLWLLILLIMLLGVFCIYNLKSDKNPEFNHIRQRLNEQLDCDL